MRSTACVPYLEASLKTFLERHRIPLNEPIAVAYSGGRDSGVLLSVLAALVGGEHLTALHVDHGLRPSAEREAEKGLVRTWCKHLGLEVRFFGPPSETAPSGNLEAWARSFRYACFSDHVATHPGTRVFLAHHAQDQAETVLMRLFQGHSWRGLGGIPEARGGLFRPFLGLDPAVLAQAARELSLPVWTDSTNLSGDFLRNHLRNEVFPLLAKRFPRAVSSLGEFAERWRTLLPTEVVDDRWTPIPNGFQIPSVVWRHWSEHERESQLLALAQRLKPECRLPGRFLELLVSKPLVGTLGTGAGFSLAASGDFLRWERVAKVPPVQYFKQVALGLGILVGSRRVELSDTLFAGAFAAGCFEPLVPLWVASAGTSVVKQWRRRIPNGSFGESALFLGQGSSVRAVVDLDEKRLVWSETLSADLNPRRFFVNLVERSEYE